MNKKEILIAILVLISAILAYILLTTERVPKIDMYLDGSNMSTTTDQTLISITTEFGPLTETYVDQKYGLSINYPKEISYYNLDKSCILAIGRYPERPWGGFDVQIYGPDCNKNISGSNPEAKNLDDYTRDYLVTKQTGDPNVESWVGIKSSEYHTNSNGVKYLEQGYYGKSVNSNTGEEQNKYDVIDVIKRYVFISPTGNQYIIVATTEDRPEFIDLEKKMINSIKWQNI